MSLLPVKMVRTVFLPAGSPPIGHINDIKAELTQADIHTEGGQLYYMGELDILIDYTAFSRDRGRLFREDARGDSGRPWQAFLTLPFALNETPPQMICGMPRAELGEINWFMAAPRALEMEVEILIETEDMRMTEAEDTKDDREDELLRAEDEADVADIPEKDTPAPSAQPEASPSEGCGGNGIREGDTGSEQTEERGDGECAEDILPADGEDDVLRIVFRKDNMPDEAEIAEAIATAKAEKAALEEARLQTVSLEAETAVDEIQTPEPEVSTPAPKKKRRSHGLPGFTVDAQNNNIAISAFNINIKLP